MAIEWHNKDYDLQGYCLLKTYTGENSWLLHDYLNGLGCALGSKSGPTVDSLRKIQYVFHFFRKVFESFHF